MLLWQGSDFTDAHDFFTCTISLHILTFVTDPRMLTRFPHLFINVHVVVSVLHWAVVSQSLRKRFLAYSFLWEQDVLETFDGFLRGVTKPHPHHFTRPETVNRARSASYSARSRR